MAAVAVSLLHYYITRVYEHERAEEGLCKDVSVASTGMRRDRRLQRSPHPPVAARYAASAGRGQGPPGHPAVDAAAYLGGLWRLETLSAVGDAARWRRRFGAACGGCGGLKPYPSYARMHKYRLQSSYVDATDALSVR